MQYYIMDVFTAEKYSGNQLAVVLSYGGLTDERMQRIAREFNFSETTFIEGGPGSGDSAQGQDAPYRVRIFTPTRELPFAGHPTLGTAIVIRDNVAPTPPRRVTLGLDVGDIPVEFPEHQNGAPTLGYMTQKAGEFGRTLDAKTLAPVLGLNADDFDEDAIAQEVSTGIPFLITPVRTLDAVRRARLRREAYDEVFSELNAKGLQIHARETFHAENQINCRVFVPSMGVPEDPATGSAAGCLAEYIRRVDGKAETDAFELRMEQGYEIDRPSLLLTGFDGKSAGPRVGGSAVMTAKGELV